MEIVESQKKERALKFYFGCSFVWKCPIFFLLSFDLVAIGGISVILIFDRSPFLSEKRTLWLPWNQFIVVEKVTMQRVVSDPPSCDISNFVSPNPIVLPSPLTSFGGSCPERGTIVPELQVGTLAFECTSHSIMGWSTVHNGWIPFPGIPASPIMFCPSFVKRSLQM